MYTEAIAHAKSCLDTTLHATKAHPPVAVVKRIKPNEGRTTKLVAEAAALHHLNQRGLPSIPTILHLTPNGPNAHLILSWLHPTATPLDHWWPTANTSQRKIIARQFGQWLAQLHNIDVPAGPVKLSDDPLPWHQRLNKHLKQAHKRLKPHKQQLEQMGLPSSMLSKAFRRAFDQLDQPHAIWPNRPRQMMHRDLRPANIIVNRRDHTLAGVVDFERAGAGDAAWDFVKIRWWCDTQLQGFQTPMRLGYQKHRRLPAQYLIEFYSAFEALTMLGYFLKRHDTYPAQAITAIKQWVNNDLLQT